MFANTEIYQTRWLFMDKAGIDVVNVRLPGIQIARDNFINGGLHVYVMRFSIMDQIRSVIFIAKAFYPIQMIPNYFFPGYFRAFIPAYMERVNLKFLKEHMKYDLVKRPIEKVQIDENSINSGDQIVIFRLDGIDPAIMYGSGAYNGHVALCLRFEGELYIVES